VRHRRVPEIGDCGDLDGFLLADSSVVATFLVSDDGKLLDANARFAASAGAATATELIGRPLLDLVTDRRDWPAWRDAALAGKARHVTIAIEGAHGQPVVLRGDLLPLTAPNGTLKTESKRLIGTFVDVTEELNLRNAVQRSARMEALGSLTSGIAHDFNNLLTVLVGTLYLAAEELRDHPKSFAKLKSARDAAKRGADLIRQLLAFAKREAVDTDVVDPSDIVKGLEPLLSRALGQRIKLNLRRRHRQDRRACVRLERSERSRVRLVH
jgi:signal transduction histidine kinase